MIHCNTIQYNKYNRIACPDLYHHWLAMHNRGLIAKGCNHGYLILLLLAKVVVQAWFAMFKVLPAGAILLQQDFVKMEAYAVIVRGGSSVGCN